MERLLDKPWGGQHYGMTPLHMVEQTKTHLNGRGRIRSGVAPPGVIVVAAGGLTRLQGGGATMEVGIAKTIGSSNVGMTRTTIIRVASITAAV